MYEKPKIYLDPSLYVSAVWMCNISFNGRSNRG